MQGVLQFRLNHHGVQNRSTNEQGVEPGSSMSGGPHLGDSRGARHPQHREPLFLM